MTFFLICIVGGAVQLGPLCTTATNRPIMSVLGDYDDGEICGMIGRVNRSTRRKPAPNTAFSTTNPTCCPDANPGRRGGKPATNRLSYGTVMLWLDLDLWSVAESFCFLLTACGSVQIVQPFTYLCNLIINIWLVISWFFSSNLARLLTRIQI
jgi:hypothetical protein